MHYEGTVYRPPSEANSILLQVTTGCSHNKCSFCGMYKGQRFSIKSDAIITADIDFAAHHFPHARRLFICDGDALVVPHQRLLAILKQIEQKENANDWVNQQKQKMINSAIDWAEESFMNILNKIVDKLAGN